MSFGEEKLVQGSEQTGSVSSILLHALQRVTVAGLVSRAAHPCLSIFVSITPVPAEAAARYPGNCQILGVDSARFAARCQPVAHSCKPSKTNTCH